MYGSAVSLDQVGMSGYHRQKSKRYICSAQSENRYNSGIVTILELYLRIVRTPTLSADSGIVPDNSRIAQGVFYRFLL